MKKTININNASVIGYKNLKNIDSLIPNELSFKIRVALDLQMINITQEKNI